jgi:hypothetical protein
LTFNEQHGATTLLEKAEVVKVKSISGPVLVYCTDKMYEELKKDKDLHLVVSDDNVNH